MTTHAAQTDAATAATTYVVIYVMFVANLVLGLALSATNWHVADELSRSQQVAGCLVLVAGFPPSPLFVLKIKLYCMLAATWGVVGAACWCGLVLVV